MTWLRQFALVVHLLGVALWLGGALALTRVASAADHEREPSARRSLVSASTTLLRAVCEPWMFAALGAGFLLVLLGPARRTSALIASRAFWIELGCGLVLALMQRALDRRVRRVAKVALPAPERTVPVENDPDEPPLDPPPPRVESQPFVVEHAPKLRRIQRVILVLAIVAVAAAVARR